MKLLDGLIFILVAKNLILYHRYWWKQHHDWRWPASSNHSFCFISIHPFYTGKNNFYPKEYFYPYSFKEKFSESCIKENTYGIHWWNDSWGSLKSKLFLESKHLKGIYKIIKKIRITARYYLIEKKDRSRSNFKKWE